MKISIPPNRNSIIPFFVLFLSLLTLQFLASCLKHWYENIYPTLHCTFAYVFVLTLSEFYPTLHCGIFIPTCIAGFKYNMKISIPPYIANLHMYLSLPYQILSHLTLWYSIPTCIASTDIEISIPPYIVLFLSLLALQFLVPKHNMTY